MTETAESHDSSANAWDPLIAPLASCVAFYFALDEANAVLAVPITVVSRIG